VALAQVGTPYIWGGESPGVGFDCSGLVQAAYEVAGITLSRVAQDQFDAARRLLDAYHHATTVERKGAVMHEGQMIDEASRKIAEAVVVRGEAAGMSAGVPA